jgi:hypothetical protein
MAGDDDVQSERQDGGPARRDADELIVVQTATGYWVVQRGDVQLAGAVTRRAAERERERMRRLASRSVRRTLVRT